MAMQREKTVLLSDASRWTILFRKISTGLTLKEASEDVFPGISRSAISKRIATSGLSELFEKAKESRNTIIIERRQKRWKYCKEKRDRYIAGLKERGEYEEHNRRRASRSREKKAQSPRYHEYVLELRRAIAFAKRYNISYKDLKKSWGLSDGPRWYKVDYSVHDVEPGDY